MDYQNILRTLESDEYYKVKKDINTLVDDSGFIKEIIRVKNPIVFDRFIKMCEYKIDTARICEMRNKFIKKVLLNITEEDVYKYFDLEDLSDSRKKTIADRYIIEYIISYYFQDNYYNFMTNFYQMLNYLRYSSKDLIDKENISIYKEFIELRNMSFNDKIGFFKLLLDDTDIMGMFYDDISKLREESHRELVNHTLKLTEDNGLYQRDLSIKSGVPIYYLDGEEFYGFVRCLSMKTDEKDDKSDYVFSKKRRLGYSFSYISHNNIGTSDYARKSVNLFYDDINYKNIMYVHHADLHAKKMEVQDEYLSNKENEITTPRKLMASTNNYNEIYIKSDEEGIKPTALICYDSISENDIDFCKKYKLSILLINTKKYKRYESYDEDYDSYSYVI